MKLTIVSFGDIFKEEKSTVVTIVNATSFFGYDGGGLKVYSDIETRDYKFDLLRVEK